MENKYCAKEIKIEKKDKGLTCPNCGGVLGYLMPDGKILNCFKCDKCYINDNGTVGKETSSPYIHKDALY